MRLEYRHRVEQAEYTQMGLWRGDEYYERRYEYAAEYLQILQELWRTGNAPTRVSSSILRNAVACPHPGGTFRCRQRRYVTEGSRIRRTARAPEFRDGAPRKTQRYKRQCQSKGGCHRTRGRHLRAVQHLTAETDEKAKEIGDDIIHAPTWEPLGISSTAPPWTLTRAAPQTTRSDETGP